MEHLHVKRRVLLIVTILLLVPAVVLAAIDSFIAVNGNNVPVFQVDLYEIDDANPPLVTYKYAVTDIYGGAGSDPGLSHWVVGLGICVENLVAPTGSSYTTPVDPAVCGAGGYDCVSYTYDLETGTDPTTGVNGIKFDEATLGFGKTHLIHITVAGETGRGPIPIAIKPGNSSINGFITGPLCEPTAVTMSGASVASSNGIAFVAVAALTMVLGVASIGVWRKNEK